MPFPYSYYQEYYNGPVNAESLKAKALYLTPSSIQTTSGIVNVAGKSVIAVDTSAGNVQIDALTEGSDGQVLFIYKVGVANSLTIKHATGTSEQIRMANLQDLTMGTNLYGGILLVCRSEGGIKFWYQIDTNGLFGDGNAAFPAITFSSDSDTGIYRKASNTLGVSTNGLERLVLDTSSFESKLPVRLPSGSLSVPSLAFSSDSDTGLYLAATALGIVLDGIESHSFNKDGSLSFRASSNIRGANPFIFTTETSSVLQQIRAGSVLASNLASDSSLVPTNGIYSKGNIKTAGVFEGTATSARWADLAERYRADAEYPPGTLVSIGGEKEVTQTIGFADTEVFGIISTAPAFKMNSDLHLKSTKELCPYVALAGRVPCRIIGKVKKGERIISSSRPGVGQGLSSALIMLKDHEIPFLIVGRALHSKETEEEGMVEVAIGGLL